jgi:flagellar hook-associated protein 2
MAITFGGLATGLDTNNIVNELMALERRPITRLETDKSWYNSRQQAYSAFDARLKSLLAAAEKLESSENLLKNTVTSSSKDFFSVSAGAEALPGASYQVEVVSLAQVQKSVSQGYVDRAAAVFASGELTLTVGDAEPLTIAVDESNNSLSGIMQAINAADAGVSAAIINDGTDSPYRLVLTGKDPATSFSLVSGVAGISGDISAQLQSGGFASADKAYFGSGTLDLSTGHQITLAGEANSLTDVMDAINAETATTGVTADIIADGDNVVLSLSAGASIATTALSSTFGPLTMAETQAATRAHIRVDNVDIYADGNSLDEAIPGLSLNLSKAEEGTKTTVSVALDEAAIKSQIQGFVKGYNDVMSFIRDQSVKAGSSGGILSGDSGMYNIKMRLQSLLTVGVNTSGSLRALSQLGLETQKDGTVKLNDEILTDAIRENLPSVEKLLVGEGETSGVAVNFQDYLQKMTDSVDGLLSANKKSTEANVRRIDSRIEQIEMRLEKKEETLRSRFNALEQLVSGMNTQSTFLTQQFDLLNNMMTRK